jgi:hypothetical protein
LHETDVCPDPSPGLLEGPRIQGKIVDIGAVELDACPGDVNSSSAVDVDDLVAVILA